MNKKEAYIGTTEASELVGCSRNHIINLIKRGQLSGSRDHKNDIIIEKSEFFRVFPDAFTRYQEQQEHELQESRSSKQDNMGKANESVIGMLEKKQSILEHEVKYLKELLDEKSKQNDFLYNQLERASIEKASLFNTINSNQRLLEHMSNKEKEK